MAVQSQLFQLLVSDGTGIKQVDIDTSRNTLQNNVNSYLSTLLPSHVLAVDFNETLLTSGSLLLTAEVTYRE